MQKSLGMDDKKEFHSEFHKKIEITIVGMLDQVYRKMMINQDTACMFACCYDNKGGHLPAHSAKPAIFQ